MHARSVTYMQCFPQCGKHRQVLRLAHVDHNCSNGLPVLGQERRRAKDTGPPQLSQTTARMNLGLTAEHKEGMNMDDFVEVIPSEMILQMTAILTVANMLLFVQSG
jgi:hypothetical protein